MNEQWIFFIIHLLSTSNFLVMAQQLEGATDIVAPQKYAN